MGQGTLVINHGDGDSPYIIGSAFPDSSSTIVELLLAMRSSEGVTGGKALADYVNSTSWADLAADARGWDVTLENSTTSVNDSGNGGVGNSAQVDGSSANVGVMLRRTRITRTTKLDSLRGREYVLLRLRTSAASKWEVQLRWSQSLAEPATVTNTAVTHDTTAATSFGYVEKAMGFIEIPEDPNATLVGVALEVWARRVSGTGNLLLDFVRLLPGGSKDVLTRVSVPAGGEDLWLGKDLAVPTEPVGFVAGTTDGNDKVLNAVNEGAGTPPGSGTTLPAGRHRFYISHSASMTGTYAIRVYDLTLNNQVTGQSSSGSFIIEGTDTLEFDANGSSAYSFQGQITAYTSGEARIHWVRHEFISSAGQNEALRADPSRNLVEKLGSDGGHFLTADVKGPVPFWIPPGLAAVFVVPFDAPKAGYNEPESVKGRTLTLSATGAPRYYQ